MSDQIEDKWRSGQHTPKYNDSADTRTISERLRDIDSRAARLPPEERKLYQHMAEGQNRTYNELLGMQESQHREQLERFTSDFLKDKEGFNLDRTSPGIRRELAEKKAARHMAEREDREQSRYLKSFLTQREGFVKYNEVEVAKKQAKQDKATEPSKPKGYDR